MKCPHCEYVDYGFKTEESTEWSEGELGPFYKGLVLSRHHNRTELIGVFGCPSCEKTFISR